MAGDLIQDTTKEERQRREKVNTLPPSIFNDVIGPVMRGPSSSHVAGAFRISSLVRQSLRGKIRKVLVDFDPNGSLAESYHGHGTDMGFVAGILNMELTDPEVFRACEFAKEKGMDIQFRIVEYGASHPNFYRIYAEDEMGNCCSWDALSTGGGMIEMIRYNGHEIHIIGDYHELLITVQTDEIVPAVKEILLKWENCNICRNEKEILVQFQRTEAPEPDQIQRISKLSGVTGCVALEPVLPVGSRKDLNVPFLTAEELIGKKRESDTQLWEYALWYETERGNIPEEEVFQKMNTLVDIMEHAVKEGLEGTAYEDRILGSQAHYIEKKKEKLVPCDVLNEVIKDITAIMETKSSMGVIVAAPTAGACACLPGTLIAVAHCLGSTRRELIQAMLAAGLVGVFIAQSATFAAEVAGCQAECGSGSGMAAAGLVQLMHGTAEQALDAASLALQNIGGLVCDPVANRVEVPCLGKNIMCGSNAISSANMILAGYDKVIPLDETIAAIYQIGLKLPLELRCTYGGLGATPSSDAIREKLT